MAVLAAAAAAALNVFYLCLQEFCTQRVSLFSGLSNRMGSILYIVLNREGGWVINLQFYLKAAW